MKYWSLNYIENNELCKFNFDFNTSKKIYYQKNIIKKLLELNN